MGEVATDGARAIKKPGEIIHEVGGARMGDNPATSVLNQFCQSGRCLIVCDRRRRFCLKCR